MKAFHVDLHIHSCLSPCGDLDMSPRTIVEKSRERGLDLIGVCDHNSAENAGAVIRAGGKRGLAVLAGLEICSIEEVHTLAVFESEDRALEMQSLIYGRMRGTNRPELFGDQVVANESDEVEGFNDRLLIAAVQMSLHDIVNEVHRLGGLSIASHVDRPSFSVVSQLGFFPDGLAFDGVEVSRNTTPERAGKEIPGLDRFPVVTFSDAHFPDEIGRPHSRFLMAEASFEEVRLALRSEGGREVIQ